MPQQDYLPLAEMPGAFVRHREGTRWTEDETATWLDSLGVFFEAHYIGRKHDEDRWLHDEWYCRFRFRGHKLTVPKYSMGVGFGGKPPTAKSVLGSLQADSRYAGDYDEFSDLYEGDEERARTAYKKLLRQCEEFSTFWDRVHEAFPEARVFDVLEELEE